MTSIPLKLIVSAAGLAFVLAAAAPAEAAKVRKHKRMAAHITVPVYPGQRGADRFRAGPVYNGPDYLGTDPDPFIRSQIFRDLNAFYGSSH